jgi:hypothetical protein
MAKIVNRVGKLKDIEILKKSNFASVDEYFIENYPENGIVPLFFGGNIVGDLEIFQIGDKTKIAWNYLFSEIYTPEKSKELYPQFFI